MGERKAPEQACQQPVLPCRELRCCPAILGEEQSPDRVTLRVAGIETATGATPTIGAEAIR